MIFVLVSILSNYLFLMHASFLCFKPQIDLIKFRKKKKILVKISLFMSDVVWQEIFTVTLVQF